MHRTKSRIFLSYWLDMLMVLSINSSYELQPAQVEPTDWRLRQINDSRIDHLWYFLKWRFKFNEFFFDFIQNQKWFQQFWIKTSNKQLNESFTMTNELWVIILMICKPWNCMTGFYLLINKLRYCISTLLFVSI